MHELSIASAVLDTALQHARGRAVVQVDLTVGALRQIVPDSLDFYFGIAARETVCEGARLEQTIVPARMRCSSCESEWNPAPPPAEREADLLMPPSFRCPSCHSAGAEVIAGDELMVESLEVQEPKAGALDNGGPIPRAPSQG